MLCYHWISALPLTDVFPGPKGKAPACLLHPRIYSPCPTAEPCPTHGRTGKGPCPCRPLSLYRAASCLILPIDAGKAGSASGLRIRGSDSSEGTCGKWPRFTGNCAVNQREHSCSRVRQEPAGLTARLPGPTPVGHGAPACHLAPAFPSIPQLLIEQARSRTHSCSPCSVAEEISTNRLLFVLGSERQAPGDTKSLF